MNAARFDILGAVTSASAARRAANGGAAAVSRHERPARTLGDREVLIERFCDMAAFAGAQVCRVADRASAPPAIAAYVSEGGLGDHLVLSAEESVTKLPWSLCPRLLLRTGAVRPGDRVSVTSTIAGVAETGTLLVASSAATPNALHFLPEIHMAIVHAPDIVGAYEDALARLAPSGSLPRAATFITGPSRTADIEKTPQIGVHGPRQLFIVVIDDPAA